jgi:hypothetical protein
MKAVPWLRWLVVGLSMQRPGFALGQPMWNVWWIKWQWDTLFSTFFAFQYHSTVSLHSHISSGGWTTGPLVVRSSETQSHPIDMNNNTLQMSPIPFWSSDVQIAICSMRYTRNTSIYLTALYSISVVRNFAECPQSNYHPRYPAAGVVLVS